MATTSDMRSYKSQLADLASYSITSNKDLNHLLGHQNPTMHSDYVYTVLLYKTSEDISGHENWCLSNTFTEELLAKAYEILSTNYEDTMIHEKFNSELICRVLFSPYRNSVDFESKLSIDAMLLNSRTPSTVCRHSHTRYGRSETSHWWHRKTNMILLLMGWGKWSTLVIDVILL